MKTGIEYELAAIWTNKINNGSPRLAVGDVIAIDSMGTIVDEDYATHKIIGMFQDNIDTTLILTNVITNWPSVLKIERTV